MTVPTSLPPGPDDGLDGAELELVVGPVAHGGHCVARDGGRVVFVRHALPGERVRAVVTEEHRSYLRADAVRILEPSPRRVDAPCPYARPGRCGGCDWQHTDAAHQRELKTAVVREQLTRLAGLSESTVDRLDPAVRALSSVPGEPDGLGWRTRVQYTVDSVGKAGLLVHRSHEVVPVERCLIAHAAVRGAGVLGRVWPVETGVEVVAGVDGDATVLARRPAAAPEVVAGPAAVTERAVGRSWRIAPTAFWQVHPSAADVLAAEVVGLLAPRPGERIWDLYGGVGLFAAALAQAGAGRLTVVEGDAAAVAAARENLGDLDTVTIVRSEVGAALDRGADGPLRGPVDLVVLDPPRSGAGATVVAGIAARRPRAVAYVACDPAALARDVRGFRSHGYDLTALRAYDLFPQTHHVECVALLTPG